MSDNPKIGQFELNQVAAEMLLQSLKTVHNFLHSDELSLAVSVDRILGGLVEVVEIETDKDGNLVSKSPLIQLMEAETALKLAQAEEAKARAENLRIDTLLLGKEKTAQQMMSRVNALFQRVERMERGHAPAAQAPQPQQPQQQRDMKKSRAVRQPRAPFNPQLAEALSKVQAPVAMNGVDGHAHAEILGSEEDLNGFAGPAE